MARTLSPQIGGIRRRFSWKFYRPKQGLAPALAQWHYHALSMHADYMLHLSASSSTTSARHRAISVVVNGSCSRVEDVGSECTATVAEANGNHLPSTLLESKLNEDHKSVHRSRCTDTRVARFIPGCGLGRLHQSAGKGRWSVPIADGSALGLKPTSATDARRHLV